MNSVPLPENIGSPDIPVSLISRYAKQKDSESGLVIFE